MSNRFVVELNPGHYRATGTLQKPNHAKIRVRSETREEEDERGQAELHRAETEIM